MKRIKKILSKIFNLVLRPDIQILPGNIAFFLILSIIPIIILIGFISGTFNIPIDTLTNFMNNYFPKEVSTILVPFFSGQGVNLNIIIFTITGFIIASNGSDAIIIASNKLYKFDNGSYIKQRIKAFNLILLMIVLVIFMLLFLAFGNNIVMFLTNNFFEGLEKYIYYLYLIIKWPIGLIFIFIIVKLIYTMAPSKRIPSRTTTKGAIFTTLLWVIVTYIYGYYVTNFADYTLFYGNLSNIIILIFWIYLISYILVFGMAINVTSYELIEMNKQEEFDNNSNG